MYKYDERKGKLIVPSPEIVTEVPFDMRLLEHLTPTEKAWVLSFIDKIKAKNPNWNFSTLYSNLKTLSFKEKSMIAEDCTGMYDMKKNRITYSKPTSIFHELIHTSTSIKDKKRYYCGFEQIINQIRAKSIGKGLNEGYTNLLENKYDRCHGWYIPEMDIEKNLSKSVPTMEELYNGMDLLGLITYLGRYASKQETLDFLEMLDYVHMYNRKIIGAKREEIKDLYYETQLYTFRCMITMLMQEIENKEITAEDAQKKLNIMIHLTLSRIMQGGRVEEISSIEELQNNVPDLSNITSEDVKTYSLKL